MEADEEEGQHQDEQAEEEEHNVAEPDDGEGGWGPLSSQENCAC